MVTARRPGQDPGLRPGEADRDPGRRRFAMTTAEPCHPPGLLRRTPHYMSPEQVAGGPLDLRSDQFSLRSGPLRAAGGRRPFDGPSVVTVSSRSSRFAAAAAPPADGLPAALETDRQVPREGPREALRVDGGPGRELRSCAAEPARVRGGPLPAARPTFTAALALFVITAWRRRRPLDPGAGNNGLATRRLAEIAG